MSAVDQVIELDAQQAYQAHCLAQMGVVSWSSKSVYGQVHFPMEAWDTGLSSSATARATAADSASSTSSASVLSSSVSPNSALLNSSLSNMPSHSGFEPVRAPEPVASPEQKKQSVENLRDQLNSSPEVIIEDLQPIVEEPLIEEEPAPETTLSITRIELRFYTLADKILVISEVPRAFSEEDELERLAVNMGQALLKSAIETWNRASLSWPGKLSNPHFLARSDWLLGAIESNVERLTKGFSEPPLVICAGSNAALLLKELVSHPSLTGASIANIVSLPELYRIPELRKRSVENHAIEFILMSVSDLLADLLSQEYTLRPADAEDASSLSQLNIDSNPHPWKESMVCDALNHEKTRCNWVVERENGQLVAWLTASQLFDQSELELILVDKTARRQGLAKALLECWMNTMQQQNVSEFLLEVRESNFAAIRLYETLGFHLVGQRKHYYPTPEGREHACLMNKTTAEQT